MRHCLTYATELKGTPYVKKVNIALCPLCAHCAALCRQGVDIQHKGSFPCAHCVQHKLVSGASGPSPIALEFEEFGQEEDLGEDNDESLARYETPRGGKRKAAAQRKGTKRRQ